MKSFYNYTLNELEDLVTSIGQKSAHARTLFTQVYKKQIDSFENIENISLELKEYLIKNISLELPKVVKEQVSTDQKTVKFLVQMNDGRTVETVLVPFEKKYTICISSQVGCAMKCSFCFTGTQGLTRHLDSTEILAQYVLAFKWLKKNMPEKSAPPNIVFMGQGEPLHNIEQVKKCLGILFTTEGLHLGPRQVTLSTAGYLPGLRDFNDLMGINLALSFHSPFDEQRNELIPLNKAYPLSEIIKQLKTINLRKRQFLTFEYLIIKDMNHSLEHIERIKELLTGLPVIFNLIPFNEFPGSPYKRPLMKDVEWFKEQLSESGFHTMVRTTKGDDILAACGQLNTK
ncbi:23S rRNA (adenine(2503)-C(2))-methyltransferase RlmN [Bacteriovorax sp. DB6_IX]|uniref:23S rRNA (adenine(2503)-C(2))-methyltransferase RlmN n=1 Tax=Bacteriovorax sp. DB6_IX TaxID=1353530 RepID=UPI00038A049C|nr:23S rRNA (adenine(2503)-C(2))-methyltransferase RlmN [Bacteriovorax sp. DB6_IX]EQC50691.1 23S rRNA (adenine(2503)-C(2))-methyltransferase [Bacteriovorax sp. DB6_IX]